ncbi:MAG TPA: alpha/beta hydrolase-fold protein [Ohtaekwangia sp.]|uniref:alpha/beta hydrolase-fold protein n=1 Tax=Ohtaekwangia sp. TaxID=2066019 RepID=UPI002F925F0F
MIRPILYVTVILSCYATYSQDYNSFTKTIRAFYTHPAEAEKQFASLASKKQIPFVVSDSVAFLYRGEAISVAWMGDFNGWGYDKNFNNKGTRIPGTKIWILKASFPADARLDYKIVVNESTWLLDPVNPNQQWSGVGGGSPNSELRLPRWAADPLTEPMEGIARGKIQKDLLVNSELLGYQVTYSIYTPPAFNPQQRMVYPILYVTDGYEYMHEQMGNMPVILDNLIHLKKIEPVIVVFIDHREPVNRSNNRRMQELAMNPGYLAFITTELIPSIEGQYPISSDPKDRAILGTSMGGLTAAYFAFSRPNLFGMAGIQSPAFWFKPDIYTLCDNPEKPPVKIFMTTGTINDTKEGAEKMRTLLNKNACTYQFREVNQGHSWGNWRDLTDDILIYFFPAN